jgi:hypothetical protein
MVEIRAASTNFLSSNDAKRKKRHWSHVMGSIPNLWVTPEE